MALSYRLSPFRALPAITPRKRRVAPRSSARIASLDVARGSAMVFVCLSHFCTAYLYPLGLRTTTYLLTVASMVASPSFLATSGMVAGFLATACPAIYPRLRIHLIDRGVFLLVVGHLVLAIASLPERRDLVNLYTTGYITDVIAIAIIIGPTLVARVSPRRRAAIAAAVFIASWSAVALWRPHSVAALTIKNYLVGVPGSAPPGRTSPAFPIAPWFAVYLLGTLLGQRLGWVYRAGEPTRARGLLRRVGATSAAIGLGLFAIARMIRWLGVPWLGLEYAVRLTSPTQKFPPGPAYLLFFGGAGVLAAWCVLELDARQIAAPAIEFLKRLGQASLLVYFVQAAIYSTIRGLSLPYTNAWPLLFLATLLFMGLAARLWCQLDGNRYFTVGISAVVDAERVGMAQAPMPVSSDA